MKVLFRKAAITDLPFLEKLEKACFPDFQQNNRRNIRYSIASPFQYIFIADAKNENNEIPVGSATLFIYPKTLRIFSIGTLPGFQGKGIGRKMLEHVFQFAKLKGIKRITLEVRKTDANTIRFYQNAGFTVTEEIQQYYSSTEDALKLTYNLPENSESKSISNIIIVRNPKNWTLSIDDVEIVSSKNYITDPKYQALKNVRIFNLSNSYQYQKMGYYVSLLASAREHRVIPNVTTLRDFSSLALIRSLSSYIDDDIQKTLKQIEENKLSLFVYFGKPVNAKFTLLAQKLYQLFEAPLLQIDFVKTDRWLIQKVTPLSLKKVKPEHMEKVQEFAFEYFSKKRFTKPRFKNYKYDLAILVNPHEKNPPSCKIALEKFKKAGEKIGFYVEFITKNDFNHLTEYDALFIRETTNVNDHTYQFSRTAYAEGLVVIDDPWSILRCSNKIFQNERLRQNKIKTPKTIVLSKLSYNPEVPIELNFPVVLKQPDSAFSLGVEKVKNTEELNKSLKKLFRHSDLIIAQEFVFSEFDWRIGVLNQSPLYACKYFMAKNHWQIYDWNSKEKRNWGASETVACESVPEIVLNTAVKAASLIGDGLYGVDLKYVDGEVYVIEINDNPNIDSSIEDKVLGNQIYERITKSIFNRIEMNRNIAQFISE